MLGAGLAVFAAQSQASSITAMFVLCADGLGDCDNTNKTETAPSGAAAVNGAYSFVSPSDAGYSGTAMASVIYGAMPGPAR